jgi:hypothetical protein
MTSASWYFAAGRETGKVPRCPRSFQSDILLVVHSRNSKQKGILYPLSTTAKRHRPGHDKQPFIVHARLLRRTNYQQALLQGAMSTRDRTDDTTNTKVMRKIGGPITSRVRPLSTYLSKVRDVAGVVPYRYAPANLLSMSSRLGYGKETKDSVWTIAHRRVRDAVRRGSSTLLQHTKEATVCQIKPPNEPNPSIQ